MEMSICPKLFYKLNKLQRKHKRDLFIIRRADPEDPIKKRKGQEESGGKSGKEDREDLFLSDSTTHYKASVMKSGLMNTATY